MREFLMEFTQAVVAQTLESMGVTAGEISQRQARKVYGKWFDFQLQNGRISPVRVESGRAGTKWYRVSEILCLKAEDRMKANLK